MNTHAGHEPRSRGVIEGVEMLKTPYAAAPAITVEGSAAAGFGRTITEAWVAHERGYHVPSHRTVRSELSMVEVDDVRATALAWLSDIAKG